MSPRHDPASPDRRPLALFVPNLAGGGAERVTVNLARGLVRAGFDVDLVLAKAEGPYLPEVPSDVHIVDLDRSRTLAALPSLARYLRVTRPRGLLAAINHANLVALWAASLARYEGPVLVAEHNELPPPRRSPWQRAFNAALRWSYPRAHKVIAVSHGVRRSLERNAGIARHHVEVIYNPVLADGWPPTPPRRPDLLPVSGPPIVLGVGRLTPQKNFANLLEAFALVRRSREARLVILGEGPERPRLTSLAERLGIAHDVSMPGFVDAPYGYIAHADAFALSSDWEGLPTVLIEALALGAPIVATDCRSGPREILDDGAFGELVPVRDARGLAVGIERVLDAPRRRVPEDWLAQFQERHATRRYLAAFGIDVPG